jgi:hypothetical protein
LRRSNEVLRYLSLVLVAGCAQSALIRDDDPIYRRALEHYRRTRQLVAESLAPDDDQAIFMQAEALYRYRFTAPGHTATSMVAEGAAALLDFPALDSLAGSLDLYGLRLRTYDGAVQLWETLVKRAPQSPLEPLVLFRLGWAYRNTQASGLPGSSNAAFDAIAKRHPESKLVPLAEAAKKVEHKSLRAATAWSIVPGLGQMYIGHYGSGTLRLGIAVAAAAAVVTPAVIAYERRSDLTWDRDWPLLISGFIGAAVLAIDYSRSYDDALRGAIELNERREAEFEAAHPDAP